MKIAVNWSHTLKLATALFVSQFTIGFTFGVSEPDMLGLWVEHIISFITSSAVFCYFAFLVRQSAFLRAWLALFMEQLAGIAILLVIWRLTGGPFMPGMLLSLAVIVCALAVGTGVGATLPRVSRHKPDA